jgi:hypothetical protein
LAVTLADETKKAFVSDEDLVPMNTKVIISRIPVPRGGIGLLEKMKKAEEEASLATNAYSSMMLQNVVSDAPLTADQEDAMMKRMTTSKEYMYVTMVSSCFLQSFLLHFLKYSNQNFILCIIMSNVTVVFSITIANKLNSPLFKVDKLTLHTLAAMAVEVEV